MAKQTAALIRSVLSAAADAKHTDRELLRQHAVKDDEKKLIQSGRESAEQLLHLFETDTDQPEEAAARTGT